MHRVCGCWCSKQEKSIECRFCAGKNIMQTNLPVLEMLHTLLQVNTNKILSSLALVLLQSFDLLICFDD